MPWLLCPVVVFTALNSHLAAGGLGGVWTSHAGRVAPLPAVFAVAAALHVAWVLCAVHRHSLVVAVAWPMSVHFLISERLRLPGSWKRLQADPVGLLATATSAPRKRRSAGGEPGQPGTNTMSEYQYYEFVAVDRRLTEGEMRELRAALGDFPLSARLTFAKHMASLPGDDYAVGWCRLANGGRSGCGRIREACYLVRIAGCSNLLIAMSIARTPARLNPSCRKITRRC